MSFDILGWTKPITKALGIIDKAVVDKDQKIAIEGELDKLQIELQKLAQQVYMSELQTKTVPWVDAFHKMGRQLLSYLTLGLTAYIILDMNAKGIEIGLEVVFAILGGSTPAGIYNLAKGKGRPV